MCCEPTNRGRGTCCVPHMCCGYTSGHRYFLSREEELELLEEYKKELEKEMSGVERKLQEMKG
ncbi:MAG TPA: hypothetical protein VMW67_02430 [Desulfobacteria bacterium]|nr:hypothetical protein [Desulfobacteria bacterium]